jgi:replication factor C subunit 3/5
MLWVDKYRPKNLADVELHEEPTEVMRRIGGAADMPHLLVYGPNGGGKRTRVMALLNEQFGPSVYNVKLEHRTIQATESKTVEITTISSPHHIDINPSDAGNYDRVVVMQMIREIAQTAPVGAVKPFKVVVLNEVDKLSRAAQQALRRTMERYMATCRLVLVCSSVSRLIPPLRSRCLAIRIPLHGIEGISATAKKICEKEGLPVPSEAFCNALAVRSEGNLRRALLMLEACKMNNIPVTGAGQDIPLPDWKHFVAEIASDILSEQSPRMLNEIRGKFYQLLGQCIPGDIVLRELLMFLLATVPPAVRPDLCSAAGGFDVNMKLGAKPIMHLEAFAAAAMKVLKGR